MKAPNKPIEESNTRTGEQTLNIANSLRKEITSGVLVAGAPLRQQQLAEKYKSSRMPVRDALRILENEGLINFELNKGARVTALDPESIREIYEMRVSSETLALKLAIPELSNRHIETATSIQQEIETGQIENFGRTNMSFHKTLYAPCNRPRLLNHIASLNELSDRYLKIALIELDYVERSNSEHHQLLKACVKRDADKACLILSNHIERAGKALYEKLRLTNN